MLSNVGTGEWDRGFIMELRKWLGTDGVDFFTKVLAKYGTLNAVWNEGGIPHPVHFREGMDVRNAMRRIHKAMDIPMYSAHWYDDHWSAAVEAALKITEEDTDNGGLAECETGAGPAKD